MAAAASSITIAGINVVQPPQQQQAASCCWLCRFQGETLGTKLSAFIVRHVGIMDPMCIAQQVSDFLLIEQPHADGAEADVVHEHIMRHMLHPRVRLAMTLRQLLDFLSLLQTSIVVQDSSGGCTVDKSNAELYLKVIAQVLTLYKVDLQGMLFMDDDKPVGTTTDLS